MKNNTIALLFLLLLTSSITSFAQKSPKAVASSTICKVVYGQPFKKGRVIFGELVPYGQVWRTGANKATQIKFMQDVVFNGVNLGKGTYTLFTIPQKEQWTIILNSRLNQWGTFNYEKTKVNDVLKTEVSVQNTSEREKLTYTFADNEEGTILSISWDAVEVLIPIKIQ